MRIGTKLLLTVAVLISLVALISGAILPRAIRGAVASVEKQRLERQAQRFAENLSRSVRGRRITGLSAQLFLLDTLLVDDAMAVIDVRGNVVRASATRPEMLQLSFGNLQELLIQQDRPRLFGPDLPSVPGLGQVLLAEAPIEGDELKGFSIVMVRDVEYIESLSRPIAPLFSIALLGVLLISSLVVGAIAREMVRRLKQTGQAAQSLADGDMTQRAPVQGSDEIADLASSFNHMAERIQTLVGGLRHSEGLRRDLLVTVSHELRTPMTSIAGFAEALRDGVVKDEKQRERYYQIIASESHRLNRLINDVFAVARLEAGQVEFRLQAMAITPWLEEVVESATPLADQSGCRLELRMAPEIAGAMVYGDRDRLDQVISNLLSNAFRFSPEGETVMVDADLDGDEVVVAVKDQGPGMSADEANHAFTRFFQGQNRGRGHHGAGLGLAIVRSLIEGHGGSVGVMTDPGLGATFWFRLKRL